MNKITLFLLVITSFNSFGFLLPNKENYLNGRQVCEKYKEQRNNEFDYYVDVPLNYDHPNLGKISIHFYLKKAFDKNLPSLIFFTGGPGASPRSQEFSINNVNVIFFEQRGIACSRAEKYENFINSDFYSSKNTARDALEILNFLQINKATIYGQSYGTVAATIFASLFKNRTQNLILEGVIFKGDKSLWESNRRLHLVKRIFQKLPQADQTKILQLNSSHKLPHTWFSKLASMVLYLDNAEEIFPTFISGLLKIDDDSFINFIQNFYPTETIEDEFAFGDVTMGMIGCKELSMNNPEISMEILFDGKEFRYSNYNKDYYERCLPLHLEKPNFEFYSAENYPLDVPTYYFLGENDGATDIHQGMKHLRNNQSKDKFVIFLKKGGHLPALGLLKDKIDCTDEACDSSQNREMGNIFEKIISNQNISVNDISKLNQAGELKFKLFKK